MTNQLALLGGNRSVTLDYEKYGKFPVVSKESIKRVVELMEKGEISVSPIVNEFENKFAEYIDVKYALCHNNGTASLMAAMYAIGIGPGDEVIVPSLTFWASATGILNLGATAIFCDVDRETYNICIRDLENKITPSTKAIVVVHIFGNPANMDKIVEIANRYKLKIIEDCSHAHGATWDGKKVGSIGDIGCFSMQGDKLLTAGEGGILVTNNQDYYERAITFAHYERINTLKNSKYLKYSFTGMGYKFRIHPLGAAIALDNLERLDEDNEIRNANAIYLENEIANIDGITKQKTHEKAVRQYSYHFVTYEKEKMKNISLLTFINALKAEGIKLKLNGYGKMHKTYLFSETRPLSHDKSTDISSTNITNNMNLPNSEFLADNTFMISYRMESNNKQLLDQYIEAYQKVYQNLDTLKDYDTKIFKEDNDNNIDMLKAMAQFRVYRQQVNR